MSRMPNDDDPAEWARLCRIEAIKSADPAAAELLRQLAREYEEQAALRLAEPARIAERG
jgi:hypothetical protein